MKSGFIKRLLPIVVTVAVVIGAVCIAALVSPIVRWRVKLVGQKLSGRIPEIPWPLFNKWMAGQPGQPAPSG